MKPSEHLLVSLALGAWRAATRRDPGALVRTVAGGVLIDLDHLPDYALRAATGRFLVILPLHGFDVLLLAWLLGKRRAGLGDVLVGALLHLIIDQFCNETYPHSYFLLARVLCRFEHDRLFRPKPMQSWRTIVRKGLGVPSFAGRTGG